MKISRETVRKVNREMIMRNGKPRELSPLEKYADNVVNGRADSFESIEAKEEFEKQNRYIQRRLLMFAELRKDIKEKFSCPDKIKQAFKDAFDKVFGNK